MFDCYGNEQIYLVKPTRIDYAIPNYGQIARIWLEQVFRTYYTCDITGIRGNLSMQFDHEQAERFAKYNQLRLITDYQQEKLLDTQAR